MITSLVSDLLLDAAARAADRPALRYGDVELSYADVGSAAASFAAQLLRLGVSRCDRVAIYSEKRPEAVIAMFGAAMAGAAYVPVNPLLKAAQVEHIIGDCSARVLVTTAERLPELREAIARADSLSAVILMNRTGTPSEQQDLARVRGWLESGADPVPPAHRVIDNDVAAILYTSGSTGRPKGVVLSHRNIVAGAVSVAEYLEIGAQDRTLCVMPLSFDYGMNQVMTAFLKGALAVLHNHLFPRDVIAAVSAHRITGLGCVPPLWIQLAQLPWPATITDHLRYITNTGGHMPRDTLERLRTHLPRTKPFLMYGLTEAFRSTYLPPSEVDRRPDSIGKAIPNAEILVVRADGTLCDADEPGELVHRGVHVALGYWNDPEKTAERYKPAPGQDPALPIPELAVWSGDTVRRDAEGYIYFMGRRDEMIKTSGYRISPTEVEETIYAMGLVAEVAAFGLTHPKLGQAVVVVAAEPQVPQLTTEMIRLECQRRLPAYMVPQHIELSASALPRNPNGKIDRKQLASERAALFQT